MPRRPLPEDPDLILTRDEVLESLPISKRTFHKVCKAGKGPPAIQVSEGRLGYRVADVREWVRALPTVEQHAVASG